MIVVTPTPGEPTYQVFVPGAWRRVDRAHVGFGFGVPYLRPEPERGFARIWRWARRRPPPTTRVRELPTSATLTPVMELRFSLRPGIVAPMALMGLLVTTILWAGLGLNVPERSLSTSGIAAVVVVILPGLLAGYLVSTAHPLTQRLYAGLRHLAFAVTALSLFAAGALVVPFSDTHRFTYLGVTYSSRTWAWIGLAFASTLATSLIVAAALLARWNSRPPGDFSAI
jgi:hypothetical protein